jgi:CheY-like chemotaxis protein/DNA-binding CsgD family transcriptional regulator
MNVAPDIGKDTKEMAELREPLTAFVEKHNLSKREHEVLALLVHQVVSAEDISEQLGISRNTVRIHLKNINTKVGTNSKSELLGRFIEFVIQHEDNDQPQIDEELFVLICDDDESYVELVKKASHSAIGSHVQFQHTQDGQQMLEYLEDSKRQTTGRPRPQLILLDLNMPKMNGFQALERIKTDPRLSDIPVVVFTSSSIKADVSSIYALGGNSYVTKPGGFPELKKVMQGIVGYWGQIGALPNR